MSERIKASVVTRAARITYRQLNYWRKLGIVRYDHGYTAESLEDAVIVSRLHLPGILSTDDWRRVLDAYHEDPGPWIVTDGLRTVTATTNTVAYAAQKIGGLVAIIPTPLLDDTAGVPVMSDEEAAILNEISALGHDGGDGDA